VNRSIAARTGHSKQLALRLTGEAGALLADSIREARRLAALLGQRARARGHGARAKHAAASGLERLAELAEKVCAQITLRIAGKPITNRLVSISDPDARPIRKGKLNKPTEFGYALVALERGDDATAAERFRETLAPCHASGLRRPVFEALTGLAAIAGRAAETERAARLIGASIAARGEEPLSTRGAANPRHRDQASARALWRSRLGPRTRGGSPANA
jgi:IS5 family transposase